mgnify:CR=1 FL=1
MIKIEGRKDDAQKNRFDLIPPEALEQLAAVYTYGCHYGERNWEQGIKWGRIFAAIMRHLWAFWRGEDVDKESGLSHLAHASWGCFTLMTYEGTHPELVDRSFCNDCQYPAMRV